VHALTATARQILGTVVIRSVKETPYMNTHLPADLEQFVQAKVRSGRFSSSDEAITAAVRLLRQQEEAEEARALEGIRQGLDDMRAGRTQPLAEAFADIRRDLNLPHGS
jgi:putative addiction module CopG family antidote